MTAGTHMAAEIAEAPAAFPRAALLEPGPALAALARRLHRRPRLLGRRRRDPRLRVHARDRAPRTSLPPSVFSLGEGVALDDALVLLVSQSGASDDLVRSARGARARGAPRRRHHQRPGLPRGGRGPTCPPHRRGPRARRARHQDRRGRHRRRHRAPGRPGPRLRPPRARRAPRSWPRPAPRPHPRAAALRDALARAQSVYVIGRDTGFGAAPEIALKLKECCALHAEAYSASEVLHGPLQLVTEEELTVLLLDTGPAGRARASTSPRRASATTAPRSTASPPPTWAPRASRPPPPPRSSSASSTPSSARPRWPAATTPTPPRPSPR